MPVGDDEIPESRNDVVFSRMTNLVSLTVNLPTTPTPRPIIVRALDGDRHVCPWQSIPVVCSFLLLASPRRLAILDLEISARRVPHAQLFRSTPPTHSKYHVPHHDEAAATTTTPRDFGRASSESIVSSWHGWFRSRHYSLFHSSH
jgi:hypothetical protein